MLDFNTASMQRAEYYTSPSVPQDPIEAFLATLADHGLNPGAIVPNGKLHRFDTDKKNNKAGWYVFFQGDICGAAFGNWKTGEKVNWCSREIRTLTDAQAAEYQRMIREANRQREAEQKKLNERAKTSAQKIWEQAESVTRHPYLKKKRVAAYGIKQSGNELIIPAMDPDGQIWTVQRIQPDGTKRFLFGGKKQGCSFIIPGNQQLYICEGYATGATIHQSTGGTVIIAFDAGNLKPVARAVRQKYPTAQITICADNDQFTPGNPGVDKAKSAAKGINANVVLPQFDNLENKPTDFNDLARLSGLDAVKNQLISPHEKQPFPPLSADRTMVKDRLVSKPAPIEFIFKYNDQGLIPKGVVGVLTATGGTGKTFFLLGLSYAAAQGGNMGPIRAARAIRTLVVIGEDTQDELDRRLWNIGKGQFPHLLHACSVYGEIGPLMRLDGNLPVWADGFYWLEETIHNHPGLELLILDPKSRFYGLDENNSDHSTQWIQSLEYLAKKYELTILFSHHTAKDNGTRISQNMSRGSSAIVDGCRWQGGIVRMDQNTADQYGIKNPRDYIEFDAPKSNYAADIPSSIFFKRGPDGVLQYVSLKQDRFKAMADYLHDLLMNDPVKYTKRELKQEKDGADIAREMKEEFPNFVRSKDMMPLLNYMIEHETLEEFEVGTKGKTRVILQPN